MKTTHPSCITRSLVLGSAALLCVGAGAWGGPPPADPAVGLRLLVSDRDNDTIWLLWDRNHDGVIDNTEATIYATGAQNPTAMSIRRDGLLIVGDQGATRVLRYRDNNHDNDARDPGESSIVATSPSPWPVQCGFVTGAGFDAAGDIYIVNAGNALYPADGVFRLRDLSGNFDCNDAGELEAYCNAGPLGPGNTTYSPQEIVFSGGFGFVRESNTTAGFPGVWKLQDLNNDGDCNDAGEFVSFWTSALAGVAPGSGFAMEIDPIRPAGGTFGQGFYTYQVATGAVDQIVRLRDLNTDGDCNDADEAVLVYSSNESGFSILDIVALSDGSLLVVDNSGKKIYRLRDTSGDGLFSADERTVFFANTPAIIPDMRKAVIVPPVCLADIADDAGTVPPRMSAPNNGVNEGDYNGFFASQGFFFQSGLGPAAVGSSCDIACDDGTSLWENPGCTNNGVNEGDYNCFFNNLFLPCG
ncbi:MAG: hypothetical protein IBJ18_11015 [Phycisphaerales bacterium]|nr:hypothetical protein [Phycisphaerales bacterium]